MAQHGEGRTGRARNAPGGTDGPRDDRVVAAQERERETLERERNDLAGAPDYQIGPDDETSGRADAERSGTARRAEAATGRRGDGETLADAEEAFRESRGDRTPRPEPDGSG